MLLHHAWFFIKSTQKTKEIFVFEKMPPFFDYSQKQVAIFLLLREKSRQISKNSCQEIYLGMLITYSYPKKKDKKHRSGGKNKLKNEC